ncbi:MAG: heme lyase CcmF/NrfE family subunit [Actinomycetota bacterium]
MTAARVLAAAGWSGTVLGLFSAVVLAVAGGRAAYRPGSVSRRRVRQAVTGLAVGAAVAFAALEVALLTDQFGVSYVAENHSRATPLLYTVTSAWSALSGSIVLWLLVLAGYVVATLWGVRGGDVSSEDRLGMGALAVLGGVAVFFFGLVATVANPFRILAVVPPDGPGPNPLLQNHIMVAFHPPLLYLGFVGFTVPFAFAVSALVLGRPGAEWLRRTRRANLVAWSFLSAGLVVGAWWSYEVLGWGGYWAWDPVENAALIPWLVATAFVHSAVVQVKRGMLQSWNFVLVLATFSLTILGTLLTRSSVISSVHSFTQSAVGPALLGFLLLVLVGGFLLLAWRAHLLVSPARPESLRSREGAFLVNNLVLSLLAFVVLLGTLYPVLVEWTTGAQVSVGRPYFDRMAAPLGLTLLLAMGLGPFLPYRYASAAVLRDRLRWPVFAGSLAAAALVLSGVRALGLVTTVFLASGMAAGTVAHLVESLPAPRLGAVWRLLRGQRGYWGGQLAHLGLAVVVVAIASSASLGQRTTVSLQPGQSVSFAGYTVTYRGAHEHQLPDRKVTAAEIALYRDGRVVRVAEPRLNAFPNQVTAVASPSVWSTPAADLYVALTQLDGQSASVGLYRYPLMWLLWTGGFLTAAGGFWALGVPTWRRRTSAATPEGAPDPAADPAPDATAAAEPTHA